MWPCQGADILTIKVGYWFALHRRPTLLISRLLFFFCYFAQMFVFVEFFPDINNNDVTGLLWQPSCRQCSGTPDSSEAYVVMMSSFPVLPPLVDCWCVNNQQLRCLIADLHRLKTWLKQFCCILDTESWSVSFADWHPNPFCSKFSTLLVKFKRKNDVAGWYFCAVKSNLVRKPDNCIEAEGT